MKDLESELIGSARLPTRYGEFTAHAFQGVDSRTEHLALSMGDISGENVLVRLHSECLTGDVFGSCRCDCGEQLDLAMQKIAEEGRGILLYLRATRAGASASRTRSAPMRCRTAGWTRSTPISRSARPSTPAPTRSRRTCCASGA